MIANLIIIAINLTISKNEKNAYLINAPLF